MPVDPWPSAETTVPATSFASFLGYCSGSASLYLQGQGVPGVWRGAVSDMGTMGRYSRVEGKDGNPIFEQLVIVEAISCPFRTQ